MQPTSYVAYNYNPRGIVSVVVNGEGGILNVSSYGGGGKEMCCALVPSHWRPGIMVTIKWQEAGEFLRDAHGQIVREDGVPVVIRRPYKQRTIEIPPYEGGEGREMGQMHIYFFPNDDVKVLISRRGPGPGYRYAYPQDPRKSPEPLHP